MSGNLSPSSSRNRNRPPLSVSMFRILLGVWLLLGNSLGAQSRPSVSLDLGVAMETVSPGGKVAMPLMLVTAEDPKVGKVSVELSFPSKRLSFQDVTKGGALESIDAKIQTEIRDSEGGEKILQVEVSSPKPIPQGVLLNVNFQVGHGIELDAEVKLKNLKQSAQTVDGSTLDAYGIDGSVTVMAPVAACFFYMH